MIIIRKFLCEQSDNTSGFTRRLINLVTSVQLLLKTQLVSRDTACVYKP